LLKKIPFLLTVYLLTLPSLGLALETSAKGPQVFLAESVCTFSPVLEGTKVSHEFIIKNQGDDALEILGVRSG